MNNFNLLVALIPLFFISATFSEVSTPLNVGLRAPSGDFAGLLAGPKMGDIALARLSGNRRDGSRIRNEISPRAWIAILMSIDLKPSQRQDFRKRMEAFQQVIKSANVSRAKNVNRDRLSEEAKKEMITVKDQILNKQLEVWSLLDPSQKIQFRKKIIERRYRREKALKQDQSSFMR